jgi:hypothetical protein
MAFAETRATRVAIISELTEGTTPATPAFTNMRVLSDTLNRGKATVSSDELRADGNVSDDIETGYTVSGDLGFEMSYSTFDSILESVLSGTWASDVLINSTKRHSATIEKTFDLATDIYRRFEGCMFGPLTLNMRAKDKITGTVGVLGRTNSQDTAIIAGATYATANTNAIMNTSTAFASFTVGGITGTPCMESLNLTIDNGLRPQECIGNSGLAGIGQGRVEITGDFTAFVENTEWFDLSDNHTASTMAFTIGTVANEKYTIELPNIRITGDASTPGINQDHMFAGSLRAIYDVSETASIKITRAVA